MSKNGKGKNSYEAPVIVPLGELAMSIGAQCSTGSVAITGSCGAGLTAAPACNSGTHATAACHDGQFSSQSACVSGGDPNTSCNAGGEVGPG
jgi:hypothetical protein